MDTQPKALFPIPSGPDEVTPDWLTGVLREAGVLERGSVDAAHWEIIGEERGFTGVVARLRPRYVDAAPSGSSPPTLIAKFSTAERDAPSAYRAARQQDAAAVRRYYERCAREVRFYHEIAPRSPAQAPRLYYGAADDAQGHVVLLLEDLIGAREGDVLTGCTPDEAALVIEAVAPFHAHWWGLPRADILPWLPHWGSNAQARQKRYKGLVDPFLEQFGNTIPAAIHDVIDRLRTRYASVREALIQAPATVIHTDLHLDNVLFDAPGTKPSAVVLDWQSVSRGPAAVDLSLFLFGSLDTQQRRVTEENLLRRYHALLVEHGVGGYSLERLRDDCRLALLWQLAGTVGWLASVDHDQLSERERALVEAALGDDRLITTLLDHDVAALLSD